MGGGGDLVDFSSLFDRFLLFPSRHVFVRLQGILGFYGSNMLSREQNIELSRGIP